MDFCLNTKTGNIVADDRYCVYIETFNGEDSLYIKRGGKKRYLNPQELSDFAASVRFFESRGSDFGEAVHRIAEKII